jgi:hypothetical protein
VGQVDALRALIQQALDGGAQHVRLELHRRRRGQHPGPGGGVELAVAQAEGVAGEPAARGGVPDAVVVAGVAGGVGEQQFAAGQLHLQGRRA